MTAIPIRCFFFEEVFGFEAKSPGWVREGDRVFYFPVRITEAQAVEKLSEAAPAGILEVEAPPLPEGPVSHHFLTMPDGLEVTWIRHPSALRPACRPYWRHHTHMFVLKNESLDFTAYTSIFAYAHLEGADTKFRIFAPGGIRWVDYPSEEAAINEVGFRMAELMIEEGSKIVITESNSETRAQFKYANQTACDSGQISDHQQSWGYEDGPWKGPGPPLLVAADLSQFISRRHRSDLHPSSMPSR